MAQLKTKFITDYAVTDVKFRARNNQYVVARNAADSANVNVWKVNASDAIEFASVPQVTADAATANALTRLSQVQALIAAAGTTSKEETIDLDAAMITAQYVDLAGVALGASASDNSVSLFVLGGGIQEKTVDYSVSLTGGAGGVTRITFLGDLATGGVSALDANDKLVVQYKID